MTKKKVNLDDFKPQAVNANKHTKRGLKLLHGSMQSNGWIGAMTAAADGEVFDGSARLGKAAEVLGSDPIVVETDGSQPVIIKRTDIKNARTKKAVRLALEANRIAQLDLAWDHEVLAKMDQNQLSGLFSSKELKQLKVLFASQLRDAELQAARAKQLLKKWGVRSGDLWQIGEHRLVCGDCTDLAVVARVMGKEKANLLFTSPPYWVGKEYETQKTEQEIDQFIAACVNAWTDFVSMDCGRICINTGSAAIHRIEKKRKVEVLPLIDKWQVQLRQRGWIARHFRIWAKTGDLPASISPSTDIADQHWEHLVTFDSEWSYLGTWWAPAGQQRGQEKLGAPWAMQGVWHDIQGQRSAEGSHVAAFPVELPLRNVWLYSQDGEIVLDPFGGSGTTMVACQNAQRRARAVEISPAYVAVSLQRMQDAFPEIKIRKLR